MRRITANMIAFRADPENPARIIAESGRSDEIGIAERELAAMQRELASMLQQKSRLAALGLAVSKINHDLRNLLASAQLFSDRLSSLPDPQVQRFAPKLMRALERAIAFCQSTLSYGARAGAAARPQDRRARAAGRGGARDARPRPDVPIRWIVAVERGLTVDADPDQLFRVLVNLARNAVQALEARGAERSRARPDPHHRAARGRVVVIEVSDTGPGVPEKARAHLFEAFQGSTRPAAPASASPSPPNSCARMAARSAWCGTIGATFRITIPDRAVELDARRGERAQAPESRKSGRGAVFVPRGGRNISQTRNNLKWARSR